MEYYILKIKFGLRKFARQPINTHNTKLTISLERSITLLQMIILEEETKSNYSDSGIQSILITKTRTTKDPAMFQPTHKRTRSLSCPQTKLQAGDLLENMSARPPFILSPLNPRSPTTKWKTYAVSHLQGQIKLRINCFRCIKLCLPVRTLITSATGTTAWNKTSHHLHNILLEFQFQR